MSLVYLWYKDGTYIDVHVSSLDQRVKWINEAPDLGARTARKQILHGYNYSADPKNLLSLAIEKPKEIT